MLFPDWLTNLRPISPIRTRADVAKTIYLPTRKGRVDAATTRRDVTGGSVCRRVLRDPDVDAEFESPAHAKQRMHRPAQCKAPV